MRKKIRKHKGKHPEIIRNQKTLTLSSSHLEIQRPDDHEVYQTIAEVVAYDESLLESCRTDWQLGDWDQLTRLNRESIQNHPDRAKLALLAAAGHAQLGNADKAKYFTRLAQDWGCNSKLISKILLAGVHNSLGRIAAIKKQTESSLHHFKTSLSLGMSHHASDLSIQTRYSTQALQIGAHYHDTNRLDTTGHTHHTPQLPLTDSQCIAPEIIQKLWIQGAWHKLIKLDNAELPYQVNRAEIALFCAVAYQQLCDITGLQRCSQLAMKWGISRNRLRLFLIAGLYNTMGIIDMMKGNFQNSYLNFKNALTIENTSPSNEHIIDRITHVISGINFLDNKLIISEFINLTSNTPEAT